MTLNFKIDSFERLWLLYCTGLTIYDKRIPPMISLENYQSTSLSISQSSVHLVNFKEAERSDGYRIQITHDNLALGNELCINCGIYRNKKELYQITYKSIIIHHNLCKATETGKQLPDIPEIFQKLYKYLEINKFQELKKDINWLYQKVKVCEICYYKLTQLFNNSDL